MAKVKCESAFTQLDKLNVRESRKLTINGQEVPVINPGYFTDCYTAMYSDSTTFAITGNVIDKFQIGRQVQLDSGQDQINCNKNVNDLTPDDIYTVNKFDYSVITGVTWDGVLTRVTIADAILTSDLEEVCLSINFPAQTLLTTTELINSSEGYPLEAVIKTTGYTTAGDGGGAEWIQNGVYAQTASQSPVDLVDGLLNDASGNQWVLVSKIKINPAWLGAVENQDSSASLNAALNHASNYSVIESDNTAPYLIGNTTIPSKDGLVIGRGLYKLIDLTDDAMLEGTDLVGVTFDGCRLDGNAANQTPLATEGNAGRALIRTSGPLCKNITIKNTSIKDSSGAGIASDDCENIRIENNNVDNVFGHGIQCAGNTVNAIIISNHVSNVDEGAGIIPMGNAKNVTVDNNIIDTVTGDGGDGITCYSDTNEHISICSNIIKSIEGHGIHTGGKYISVTGNTINQSTAGGIYISAQTITSDTVSVTSNSIDNSTTNAATFGRHGVHINNVINFSACGNSINNGQDSGIRLKQSNTGVVSSNSISNSLVNGIYAEIDAEEVTYSSNTVNTTGGSGIKLDNESKSIVTNNIIENYSTTDASSYGIEVVSGTVLNINNNHVRQGSGTIAPTTNGFSGAPTVSVVRNNIISDGTNIRKGDAVVGVTSTIPAEYDFIVFNGAFAVETIDTSTSYEGREIIIQAAGGVSFIDNIGNLRIAGNFAPGGSSSIIKLILAGSNWLEVSRSSN